MKRIFKSIFTILTTVLFVFSSLAQEKTTLNNSSYYIYPIGKEANMNWIFQNGIDRKSEENKELLFNILAPQMAMDEENYEMNYEYFLMDMLESNLIKMSAKQLRFIRSNSSKFYSTGYNIHRSVTPSLDPLQDGKYIQYYDKYYTIDAKGMLVKKTDQPAGFFELKKNLPEGFACWLNPYGDTVEQGYYLNGKKTGKWIYLASEDGGTSYEELIKKPKYNRVVCYYKEGMLNGEYEEYYDAELYFKGFYTNGNPSGEWFNYGYDYLTDTIYLREHFSYAGENEFQPVHQPLVRNMLFDRLFNEVSQNDSLNFPINYNAVKINFNALFKIKKEAEEDLELPEEKLLSYEGEDYGDYTYGGDEGTFDYNTSKWFNGKYLTKAKIIDSIGITFLYKDVYEEFYPNGKFKYRYEFENGKLKSEDTVFWDNGKAANVVVFYPDTKRYSSRCFDYKGKLIVEDLFDSLGSYIENAIDNSKLPKIVIDGFKADYFEEYQYYEYNAYDTLKKPLNEKLTFYKSWYADKKPYTEISFDPLNREAQIKINSFNRTPKLDIIYSFGEDYKFFSSKNKVSFKDLSMITLSNGSYEGNEKNDSVPHAKIYNLNETYNVTHDYTLNYKDNPFSGTFSIRFRGRKPSFSFSENKLAFGFTEKKFEKKLDKELTRYHKTAKTKYRELFSFIDKTFAYEDNFYEFYPQLYELISPPNNVYYEGEYYGEQTGPPSGFPYTDKLSGAYLDGKPNGVWTSYDQFGKIRVQMEFLNGEKHGEAKFYNYAYPTSRFDYYYDGMDPSIEDLPKVKTYFLEEVKSYHKGILNGEHRKFDWKGNVTFSGTYRDGYYDGLTVEKNKYFYTNSTYEEGLLDGIVQTRLTLPERDTILLYDLNFQNHQLQGESRSYHSNGKLAKRGFFLNNEPIEDYEAYDSLGTKYHYVKFQYTFPVEEKIWEENELSVRYLFDWQDSIYFRPGDLVDIPSLYELLMENGLLGQDVLETPYMGRASLIDKTGIDYHVTKYFPNQVIARDGQISKGKKTACWYYQNYNGEKLYEIDYFDTILKVNDSIRFKSKGILTDFDSLGNVLSKSYVIEKIENYDCSHTDHYENRQFYTIWQKNDSIGRMNGYVKNYYDDGTLQSEGNMKEGLPSGIWKFYTPNGQLNQVGEYVQGKRNGRWLSGDLSKTNYLGDICLNPNLPDLEKRIAYQENLLDIQIRYFKLGKIQKTEVYDLNMNKNKKTEE